MNYSISLIERKYVFKENKNFASCHASTLLKLDEDQILTAAFGGTAEGNSDVNIWLSASDENGSFSDPVCISHSRDEPHWNPVLFRGGNGTFNDEIILFFKVGMSPREWRTVYCKSFDNGKTWQDTHELIENDDTHCRGPVKNKPVRTSDGSWLAPSSVETADTWAVQIDRSPDMGKTWELLRPLGYITNPKIESSLKELKTNGVIQPSLWEYPAGSIHMLMRSTWGRLYRSDSADCGRTWSFAYETKLPNNNSGIDLTITPDNIIALCMNPVDSNWGMRTPLTIMLSEDNGESFYHACTLESGKGEFSYPAVISDGEFLHATYTWNRKNIVYVKLRISKTP